MSSEGEETIVVTSSGQIANKKKYVDKSGRQWDYKLAWKEDETQERWSTAYGNSWFVTSSILIFSGSCGNIVLSPSIVYVVK